MHYDSNLHRHRSEFDESTVELKDINDFSIVYNIISDASVTLMFIAL